MLVVGVQLFLYIAMVNQPREGAKTDSTPATVAAGFSLSTNTARNQCRWTLREINRARVVENEPGLGYRVFPVGATTSDGGHVRFAIADSEFPAHYRLEAQFTFTISHREKDLSKYFPQLGDALSRLLERARDPAWRAAIEHYGAQIAPTTGSKVGDGLFGPKGPVEGDILPMHVEILVTGQTDFSPLTLAYLRFRAAAERAPPAQDGQAEIINSLQYSLQNANPGMGQLDEGVLINLAAWELFSARTKQALKSGAKVLHPMSDLATARKQLDVVLSNTVAQQAWPIRIDTQTRATGRRSDEPYLQCAYLCALRYRNQIEKLPVPSLSELFEVMRPADYESTEEALVAFLNFRLIGRPNYLGVDPLMALLITECQRLEPQEQTISVTVSPLIGSEIAWPLEADAMLRTQAPGVLPNAFRIETQFDTLKMEVASFSAHETVYTWTIPVLEIAAADHSVKPTSRIGEKWKFKELLP